MYVYEQIKFQVLVQAIAAYGEMSVYDAHMRAASTWRTWVLGLV